MGGHPLPVNGILAPERGATDRLAWEYHREVVYNQEELAIRTDELQSSLTNYQRHVYNTFLGMLAQEDNYNNSNVM